LKEFIDIPFKTGVYTPNKCLVFRDGLGGLFYESRGNHFNLPKGKYRIMGAYQLIEPVIFPLNKMPYVEKAGYNFRNDHKLVIAPNPNKAQIDTKKCIIYIDPSFYEKGSAMTQYILSHEIAHHFYNTEEFCDAYAENKLLKLGYNPSQFMSKFFEFMSKNKEQRINSALKRLKKWQRKH